MLFKNGTGKSQNELLETRGTNEMMIEKSLMEASKDKAKSTKDVPISKEEAVRLAILKTG